MNKEEAIEVFAAGARATTAPIGNLMQRFERWWSEYLLTSYTEKRRIEAVQVHDEWASLAKERRSEFDQCSNAPSPTWFCQGKSCPERPPVSAASAPKCYTCDKPMSEVSASPIEHVAAELSKREIDRLKNRPSYVDDVKVFDNNRLVWKSRMGDPDTIKPTFSIGNVRNPGVWSFGQEHRGSSIADIIDAVSEHPLVTGCKVTETNPGHILITASVIYETVKSWPSLQQELLQIIKDTTACGIIHTLLISYDRS